jgi:pyruvate,water dikinase
MATGDGLYHYYRSWKDDPSIPYASIAGHISAISEGRLQERPTEELARERDRLAEGYAELLSDEQRGAFNELLALSRTVFPYVEDHKFYCDYWFLTAWYNKVREFGALLATHAYWASGGLALGPTHWPAIAARRKTLLARLADWTPPPALGTMPEAANDPITVMLWGIAPERLQSWAQDGESSELHGSAAAQGVVEGVARVVRSVDQIGEVRDGEVLVCGSTSPAWAPIFSRIIATVTDIGGVMSHTAIVCREYGLPAVVGTGRATERIKTGDRIRVDGTAGTVTLL